MAKAAKKAGKKAKARTRGMDRKLVAGGQKYEVA